jgi:hypothetical protein
MSRSASRGSRFSARLRPTAIIVVLAAHGAAAQSLDVLGPSGTVPPDGFTVGVLARGSDRSPHAPAQLALEVEGGDARAAEGVGPLRTYWIIPRRGARTVSLRARAEGLETKAAYDIGPPSAKVELSLGPAAPVKNRDTSAELTVRLLKADGSVDPDSSEPVLRSNVGHVEGLARTAPGTFHARYVLPETRYPEVVVIVAFAPWPHPQSVHGAIGSLLVPLASAIDLPGKTEHNATISVEIAGITYGPVVAGPDGRFKLPVVVPPGHRFGRGTAVDRAGNRKTTQVDLQLPPTDQLSCVQNPTRLPANGIAKARVICATSDPYGKPFRAADVKIQARHGALEGPRPLEGGLLEWIYTAPSRLGEAELISATWKQAGPMSKDELTIDLVQGPAAKVALTAPEKVVYYGGTLALGAAVTDVLGRPRPGAQLELSASPAAGSVGAPHEVAPGQFSASWELPPDGEPGPAHVTAKAMGPLGSEPAQLFAWLSHGSLRVGVTDLVGLPVPGQRLSADNVSIETGADGTATVGPAKPGKVELRLDAWPSLRRTLYVFDDRTLWPAGPSLDAPTTQLDETIGPPIPINIRAQVHGHAVTYWAEDARGALLPGRALTVEVTGGSAGTPAEHQGRYTVMVDAGRGAPASLSVADRATGVTAVVQVP